jgi:hypothetical protein
MILIIAEDKEKIEIAKKEVKKLHKTDYEIKTLLEISRILVPMSKEKRAYLYDYGKKAKELAQEADMVYLYREKLIRLK